MANTFFQCKQFTIQQHKTAMKVCTDSCLFGSLLPLQNGIDHPIQNVLDVGTGTGLLSLMYAQQNTTAKITALEIEPSAVQQAIDNIQQSPFVNTIMVLEQDFFTYETSEQWDLIICNPPFYINDLRSPIKEKIVAHHNPQFSLELFIQKAVKLLTDNGCIVLLLPYKRNTEILAIATNQGLFPAQQYLIKQTPKHDYFRVIYNFTTTNIPMRSEEIIIKADNQYTNTCTALLKPFYLHL
jgi:tRNA1Val (adenine37-N6)-methyltransferase